jgi:hypothetical protein
MLSELDLTQLNNDLLLSFLTIKSWAIIVKHDIKGTKQHFAEPAVLTSERIATNTLYIYRLTADHLIIY